MVLLRAALMVSETVVDEVCRIIGLRAASWRNLIVCWMDDYFFLEDECVGGRPSSRLGG